MSDTISNLHDSIEWLKRYGRQAPERGDFATDFELRDVSGGNPIQLSDFHGKKPVALIFGSFT